MLPVSVVLLKSIKLSQVLDDFECWSMIDIKPLSLFILIWYSSHNVKHICYDITIFECLS